jgi:hypothetical protein
MERYLSGLSEQAEFERSQMHFALGKAYDDHGAVERAFPHFAQGNRLARTRLRYDEKAILRQMERLDLYFSKKPRKPALLSPTPDPEPAGRGLVFVVGMPRSGTTLLAQILGSHPAIDSQGELDHLTHFGSEWWQASSAAQRQALEAEMPARYAQAIGPAPAGVQWRIDKAPTNFLWIGLIAKALPGAKILHMQRDPLDTCLSCYTKHFAHSLGFTYDLEELGRFYRGYDILMARWRGLLASGTMLEISYEALVAGLEVQTRRALSFLDLPFDPACLTFNRSRRAVGTASLVQVRQPLNDRSVGRAQAYLPFLGPLRAALAQK